jgi:predicted helicase
MNFQKILDKYRKIAFSERDKGDRFERLMQAYLKTDPKYSNLLKNVWMWNEFPGKLDLGGGDTGIDLVALTHEGDYWAIQCKCFQEDSVINKPAVDTFLSTSSREFKNEQMQTTRFAHRLWISTTNKWGSNAQEAIRNQNPPVSRINLFDLIEAPVNWQKIEDGVHGEAARTPKKSLRPHQKDALNKTHEHFKIADRGKLIMACGTGKTFNSLRIAEHETNGNGLILFLVPSIALLGQALREWSADANEPINAIAICSDPDITQQRKRNEDTDSFSVVDLALPASTDTGFILHQFEQIKKKALPGMTVVFSTYQSIEVLARAQKAWLKNGFPEFDLIICDEAHRTTGVSLAGEDESAFTKVHDPDFIKAKKRLYMTATPRLYSDDTKSKAAQAEAILCSMDDKALYGEEMYRIGFGEAVERDLLTDYKVLILTLNDKDVPESYRKVLTDQKMEINTDDASKLIGTINALSKQFLGDEGITKASDPVPMKRAVAFCANIATSKKISASYNIATEAYLGSLPPEKKEQMVTVAAQHMDGTMAAPARDEMLSWLKEETEGNECRIITNVRVLSEGVDVPSLDSVLFLSARNSQVDVVQSVGRVMRKSPGKKYGYIVIPVVVPAEVDANIALDDNERYKVVWTVLNALRAHDDRFNATVHKIELNRKKPNNILVGRPEYSFDEHGNPQALDDTSQSAESTKDISRQLTIQFEQLQSVVFARMVKKVGDRKYWEDWAKEVAQIAERQIERITYLIETKKNQKQAFDNFLAGLQKNINPSINERQAVEMLAQHIITKPIFEALFEGYSFTETNAVSVAMQTMLNALEEKTIADESDKLQKFYDSVKRTISDLDNADAKQKIIIRIYDNFFKTAFPKMVEQLGIVYTPVEVVDFIIHSVNDVLQKEFERSISDENIHVLDPFTGTGTFITRLLQSGLINIKDLARKYHNELHANEIVLLAYYIAAVNIENAYHDQLADALFDKGDKERKNIAYEPFEGIVLTDTFQLGETDESKKLFSEMFPQNSERVERQKKAPLRVIIGNPPYSRGQEDANDNAQNQNYPKLEDKISKTYAVGSDATLSRDLYNSYIKAFRWSTDRLKHEEGGIIAFISGNGWIDKGGYTGFRKSLEKEFSSIYVFNLRGDIRGKSRESAKREGQNVFDIMTGVAITLLVKKPKVISKAKVYYHNIDDYLNRKEKLSLLQNKKSINNIELTDLKPNEKGDWINQRTDLFSTMIPIEPDKNFDFKSKSFFLLNAVGSSSAREPWVYNFSEDGLKGIIKGMISYYNSERINYQKSGKFNLAADKISWSVNLKNDAENNIKHSFEEKELIISSYRPFTKSHLYYHKPFIERPGIGKKIFPKTDIENLVITIAGKGNRRDFVVLISKYLPDYNNYDGGCKYFPLYYFEERKKNSPTLFDAAGENQFIRRDGVSDFILDRAKKQYGKNVGKEDIFYFVYGILHSPDYRTAFTNDLKKMLPRIPLVEDVRDFWKFSKAGRQLAELHINYEAVPPAKEVLLFIDRVPQKEIESGLSGKELEAINYKVQKMRFPKKDQKDTIIFNSQITIENIPAKAYEYVVNGKSAIEWIMERYQVKTDPKSGIKNDPNDWAKEVGNPKYILDLLLSIINVSVQTVDIVSSLPKLEFDTEIEEKTIQENDIVVSKVEIAKIPVGSVGTVVHVYKNGEAFEIEFVKKDGSSSVETALLNQIEKK